MGDGSTITTNATQQLNRRHPADHLTRHGAAICLSPNLLHVLTFRNRPWLSGRYHDSWPIETRSGAAKARTPAARQR